MKPIFQILLLTLLLGFSQSVEGQCDGSFNNGVPNLFQMSGDNINVGISGFDFVFERVGDVIQIRSNTGLNFLEGFAGAVRNVNAGEDITTLTPYVSGPLEIFNLATNLGPFGGGATGFIAVEINGRYGWIELGNCGAKVCSANTFEAPILNRCLSASSGGTVLAGNINTLGSQEPIPTLSEWSLIILFLMFSIMLTLTLKTASVHNEKRNFDGI